MNDLLHKSILILDCQTTGTHPKNGYLLQLGWGVLNASMMELTAIEKWTLKLPPAYELPSNIKRMLNLSPEDLQQGADASLVFARLQKTLDTLGEAPIVIAHYAQFENNFLKAFYLQQMHSEELNFSLHCSQRIAKRLFPFLPSHNLKAMAGHFGMGNLLKNDIGSHLSMTFHVWKNLVPELTAQGILTYSDLLLWMEKKQAPIKQKRLHYNIASQYRLEIPHKPGVYKMLAKDKTILYVGKATSLKSRVNSYFRGVKNRSKRILEMLAQVWDIDFIECPTPLEAALLESDEIKRWQPVYNILLKSEERTLIFYDRHFNNKAPIQDTIFRNGPYKYNDGVVILLKLLHALRHQSTVDCFSEFVPPQTLALGWNLFCKEYNCSPCLEGYSSRHFLLLSYKLLKTFEHQEGKYTFETWWAKQKKIASEEELSLEIKVARKIFRIFIRAAQGSRKSRQIRQLFNTEFIILSTQQILSIVNGAIVGDSPAKTPADLAVNLPSTPFNISQYDRLSILLQAKIKKLICIRT